MSSCFRHLGHRSFLPTRHHTEEETVQDTVALTVENVTSRYFLGYSGFQFQVKALEGHLLSTFLLSEVSLTPYSYGKGVPGPQGASFCNQQVLTIYVILVRNLRCSNSR